MLDETRQIAIVGTGLLGTSLGLALKASGFGGEVVGVGRRQATLDEAVAGGGIDRGVTDFAKVAGQTDLVVVAVPLGRFGEVMQSIAAADHDGLIVTDVGSTKVSVLEAAREFLPEPGRFCGAHPMAGSEQKGPGAARPDLFTGKPCILTPAEDTQTKALETVQQLWAGLGMRLLTMDPAEHDRKTAVISHLPHALAVMLINVVEECGGWEVASTGLKDTSRLASSNPPMRADILTANREAVGEALDVFARHLDALRSSLKNGKDAVVLDTLTCAKQVRDGWLQAREREAAEAAAPQREGDET